MRPIGLSHSAAEKFARFLLEQASDSGKTEGEVCLTLTLTHEEIAQMIGSSRETVTRLFSDFKKKAARADEGFNNCRAGYCSSPQVCGELS